MAAVRGSGRRAGGAGDLPLTLSKNVVLACFDEPSIPTTIAASSEDSAHPAASLLSGNYLQSWRGLAGALSGVALTATWPAGTTIGAVLLQGTNLCPASATRRVQMYSDTACTAALGATGADSGTGAPWDLTEPGLLPYTPPWGRTMVYLPPAPIAGVKGMKITLTDPTPGVGPLRQDGTGLPKVADNYLRAAIFRAGQVWQPGINVDDQGTPPTYSDTYVGDQNARKVQRSAALVWHRLTEAERSQLRGLLRVISSTGRLLLIPYPLRPQTWLELNLWCRVNADAVDAVPIAGTQAKYWQLTVPFQEVDT